MWVNPTSAVIALKTAVTVGFKPQWMSSNTLSDYALMNKITGGLWEGVITGVHNWNEVRLHAPVPLYRLSIRIALPPRCGRRSGRRPSPPATPRVTSSRPGGAVGE